MDRPVEPGLLKLFRYFAGVGILYFAILWLYASLGLDETNTLGFQSQFNVVVNVVLFIYLSIGWLEKKLRRYYLPIALAAYSVATVLSSLIYFVDPSTSIFVFLSRSWALFPILFIPLVFIAWQYRWYEVMAYNIFVNGFELLLSLYFIKHITISTIPFAAMPIVRAFAFGIVGHIVLELVETQRQQKLRLIQANLKLGQFTNTLVQLAESRERNRIARELHDTLAHTLSGVAVNLEATKTLLPAEGSDVNDMLDHSLAAVRVGLNETRRVLQNLRAQPLEDVGLVQAMSELVKSFAGTVDLEVRSEIDDDLPAMPPAVEQALYRVTQESLENVRRHAGAKQVLVTMKRVEKAVVLEIRDDGKGVRDISSAGSGHFGIEGMKERAAAIGAEMRITSSPQQGTAVRMEWEGLNDQSADL